MEYKEKKQRIIFIAMFIILTICLIIFLCISKQTPSSQNENKTSHLIFENTTTKKQVGRPNNKETKEKNIYSKISYPTTGEEKVDSIITSKIDELKQETVQVYNNETENVNTYYFVDYEIYFGIDNILSLVLHENIETIDLQNTKKDYIYLIDINEGKILKLEDIFKEGYKEVLNTHFKEKNLDESKIYLKEENLVFENIEVPIAEIQEYIKRENKVNEFVKSDIEEPIYTLINKEYVALLDTVLYKDASLNSDIIGNIKKDDVIKVYQENNKGWSLLLYNDKIAYVESNKITKKVDKVPTKTTEKEPEKEKTTYYAITNINLRSEASTKSETLAEIKRNEKVIGLEKTGSWTKVKYKDLEGYVSTSYLSKTMVKNKVLKENVPPQEKIDPTKPMVALTFDDGPNPISTPRILDTLEKYNVGATFFDLGNLMLKYPDVVKREEKIGEVGTHTFSHKNLNAISSKEIENELEKSKNAFNQILGHDPLLLRPPYGNANSKVRSQINLPLINWNVDSLDWKYQNKDLILHEIDKYGNLDGKIILMHSIYKSTAEAVEILVPDLLDQGYQIVTVTDLANYRGVTLENNKIYYNFSK